ncbi:MULTISPECIES: carbohydrate ABC transporter permease [Paenibacillus]|uniref:ABC transporter permease n=1 Tax=Paenibacillus agaridevorans TaxID=171404 RepID=A0A2R5ET49_9BACL|nr:MULTISPECIES: carbohydrate ABC transporter permease [Paenibacillus]QNK56278.1 carbohydrate ABC transporter permease [Paenibacillus sp. PAMC21692]GBG09850.1 ABC transporter permease [Paenibacillus agaridevorans]
MNALRSLLKLRRRPRLSAMDGFQKLLTLLLIVLSVFMLLPIVYIFNHAFKPYHELFLYPPTFFVQEPSLQNVNELLAVTARSTVPMIRYLFNSVFVSALAVLLVTGVSALCAFPLSKHRFPGAGFVFAAILLTLMFAPEVVQIPRYLVVSEIGIMNTYFAHLLPLMAMPIGVFLLKQFVDQIPDSLLEAARIDGASEFVVFLRIVVPVCMPAIATVAILAFQNSWGNIETSALFMLDDEMKSFAFFLSTLTNNLANNVAMQGAAAVASLIMFVPNLIVFVILQSKVIATMAHSGIK